MSGIKDLQEVMASMQVSCDDIAYGFATVSEEVTFSSGGALAMFREKEGTAVIDTIDRLKKQGIKCDGPFAKLTVEAHTSLDMIGLTAVLSTSLAEQGISANVVAAYYHDHIFVRYEHRNKALKLLNGLKNQQ